MQLTPTKEYVIVEKNEEDTEAKVGQLYLPARVNVAKVVSVSKVSEDTPKVGTKVLLKYEVKNYIAVDKQYIVPLEDIIAFYEK